MWICGILAIQYHTPLANPKGKKNDLLLFPRKSRQIRRTFDTAFYLKINRNENYAIVCLNQWFKIAQIMNADCYIICDNKALQKRVEREVDSCHIEKKFLPSMKKPKIIKHICTSIWAKNAGNAYLSTFYYAKSHGYNEFWNIDADDTMFLLNAKKCAQILSQVAIYANAHKICAFSLDMWHSRTLGTHFSFGITYTSFECDWFKILEGNKDSKWQEKFMSLDNGNFNLDWFFTYLGASSLANVANFYIENAFFIHFGDFFVNRFGLGLGVSHWQEGKLRYPLLLEIYGSKRFGEIPIAKDCIKFDANLNKQDAYDFMQKEMSFLSEFHAWKQHWVSKYYQ